MSRTASAPSSKVEAKGRMMFLPNSRKRKSPGKRPIPNFSNQGKAAGNTISARKMTRNQRNIGSFTAGGSGLRD
jgi:hypothetical protein